MANGGYGRGQSLLLGGQAVYPPLLSRTLMRHVAVVCRQGAVRSAFVAARLVQLGVGAVAYGWAVDDVPIHPLTVEVAREFGVKLGGPRVSVRDLPPECMAVVLDQNCPMRVLVGAYAVLPRFVEELVLTGQGDRMALRDYFDRLSDLTRLLCELREWGWA